jgi:phosphopantetheine--protein transferase-like protein
MNLYTERNEFRIGFDVVSVSRIASILQHHPEAFRCYAFTDAEQKYCEAQYYPPENYAVRWAIKEAYIKAVNIQEKTPDLTSIEINHKPVPHLSVTGDGLEMLSKATERRDTVPEKASVDISLTHERKIDTACGFVMILF